jgi:hypothetical protein
VEAVEEEDEDEELAVSDFFSVAVLVDESLLVEEPLLSFFSFAFAGVAAEEPLRLSVR